MPSIRLFCSTALIALAVPALPAIAQQAPATAITPAPLSTLVDQVKLPYEQFTLENGLRVIVHTDRKAPVVALSVWYDVGSKHEPAGKTGFAHLFEHLMFNGSQNAPGDFFEPLKQVGATDLNGTTYYDRTNYFETVPRPALERALFLESDRMGWLTPAITQGVLDEQRGVVQNEKRQGDNQPYGLVEYTLAEGLFGNGPYGHSVIGSMADLDKASVADVKGWFHDHYGPNNAVLSLAGDIDAAEARPLVEKYFGKIARGPKSELPKVTIPTLPAPKTVVLKDRVPAIAITRNWAIPGLNDPDAAALDVFGQVLGGLASSRLANALVREEKLAVQASAYAETFSQAGTFTISVTLKPGVEPATVNKRIDAILAELIAKGPTADEVQRVATTSVSDTIKGLQSTRAQASVLAEGELYSNDPGFFRKRLEEVAKMTPAKARAAAAKWLTRPAFTIIVEPGDREAYQEAAAVAPAKPAAEEAIPKGDRGPLPDVGPIRDIRFPTVERTRLANGAELIYARQTAVPVTRMVFSFDAGATADPDGKPGTQNLTLSLMDEGTTTRSSIAIAEAKERLGAEIGEGSSADRTYLTLGVPSANLGGGVELFSDIVRHPAFAPAEVERLRATTLTGIQFELSSPSGLANRAMPGLLYGPANPYAKLANGSGDPAVVAKLSRDELVAFHRAWIRPDKAKVFVVSDLPLAQVKAALDARFGDWKGEGADGVKAFSAKPQQASPRIVLVDRPNSPQSLIVAGQMTPLDPASDLLVAVTANQVLGGGFLSRINMDLRETRHWSYGAGGGFNWLEHAVPYAVNAPVQADRTGDSIKSIRDDVRAFLTTSGVTPAELAREIAGSTRELAGRFETANAVLAAMQQNDIRHRPDDYYDSIAQKYRSMTAAQLDAAARGALDVDRFVWVVVGDAAKVRPQLDSLGLPVEVISASSLAGKAPPATK
ncbi:M16 family metallopeptidase [Sphingomonas sp. TDK1]|uniref:M16 family metallopeptidase n=1 Tax=Sphingomonas sp. TDK1 TaxID=453247 RepID=UPI0007D931D9|nr:pitrilysin family protein [Sphingomonas sp. TDK1]OAN66084.1 peptidase M16 [Sphingomonas sp. TDK1]